MIHVAVETAVDIQGKDFDLIIHVVKLWGYRRVFTMGYETVASFMLFIYILCKLDFLNIRRVSASQA